MHTRLALPAVAALAGVAVAVVLVGRATALGPEHAAVAAGPTGSASTAAAPQPSGPASPPKRGCGGELVPRDPLLTAERFLETAVARQQPGRGFALATRDLRGATTCRDWIEGRLPVAPYPGIDWTRSNYRVVATGEGQVVLRVVLFGKRVAPAAFLMELRRDDGSELWQVGTWMVVALEVADRRPPAAPGGRQSRAA